MIAFGFEDKRAAKPPKVCLTHYPPVSAAPVGTDLVVFKQIKLHPPSTLFEATLSCSIPGLGNVPLNLTWNQDGDPLKPTTMINNTSTIWSRSSNFTYPMTVTINKLNGDEYGTLFAFGYGVVINA